MQRSLKLTSLVLPSLLVLFATSTASALVARPECSTDADCGPDQECLIESSAPACDPSVEGGCGDVIVEEFGSCVALPASCETDEDCGEYLGCESSEAVVCSKDLNSGETSCEEPDPDARKTCEPVSDNCEADSDCPRDFECVADSIGCTEIACPDDAPDCNSCSESEEKQCQPKNIACDTDAECPADWSCSGPVTYDCGGGSDGDSGGGGEVVPDDGGTEPADGDADAIAPEPDPVPCEPETVPGACYPNAWGSVYEGSADPAGEDDGAAKGGDLGGEREESAADADEDDSDAKSSDKGGCAVSPAEKRGSYGWLSLLLLAAPLLRRRQAAKN